MEELEVEVASRLEHEGVRPASGRIRAVPDARTIRYYGTLGLIDRPAELRGRTAYYSRRHLLQILAIKRLQASGSTLVEVQAKLAGADDAGLRKIAELSEEPRETGAVGSGDDAPAPPHLTVSRRGDFWRVAPADPTERSETSRAEPMTAVRFQGLTLLFSPRRALDESDLERLADISRPVIDELVALGLMHDPKEGTQS
ncbi:MAG: MerR family transcriptional regulator [Deltaproteobacteria bacterium]|nr:MerR family transcriptional regulator [Deltaproteobacteria bacterium]